MILIASPCGSTVNRNFIECREDVIDALRKMKYVVDSRLYEGPNISANRNEAMLDVYYKPLVDWIIFIDTDMEFGYEDIRRLIEHGGDVVTGICKNINGKYCLYDYDNKTNIITNIEKIKPVVDACGSAFLAIRRRVIQKLCSPDTVLSKWKNINVRDGIIGYPFNYVTAMKGNQFGEDVSFCLRLKELGIETHVAKDAKIGHEKITCIR